MNINFNIFHFQNVLGVPSDDDEDTCDVKLMSMTGDERNNELRALLRNRWDTRDFVLWRVKIHQNFLFFNKMVSIQ